MRSNVLSAPFIIFDPWNWHATHCKLCWLLTQTFRYLDNLLHAIFLTLMAAFDVFMDGFEIENSLQID